MSKLEQELLNIPGMGKSLARKLMDAGLERPSQLRLRKFKALLSNEVALSVKYGLTRTRDLPWDFVNSLIHTMPAGLTPVGSFRRKRPFLKDLDLITLQPLEKMRAKILARSKRASDSDFALEPPYDVLEHYSSGERKHSFIIKFKGRYIRVDLFRVPDKSEWPYALLHFTGSQEFNIKLRAHAKRQGLKLNQYGLFNQAGKKLDLGPGLTEKKIMEYLHFKYVSPKDR